VTIEVLSFQDAERDEVQNLVIRHYGRQDKQYTFNVTFWRFRVAIVAVEQQ